MRSSRADSSAPERWVKSWGVGELLKSPDKGIFLSATATSGLALVRAGFRGETLRPACLFGRNEKTSNFTLLSVAKANKRHVGDTRRANVKFDVLPPKVLD